MKECETGEMGVLERGQRMRDLEFMFPNHNDRVDWLLTLWECATGQKDWTLSVWVCEDHSWLPMGHILPGLIDGKCASCEGAGMPPV